jgi:hypothetical protein
MPKVARWMRDDFEQYAGRVRTDHYAHRLGHLAVSIWAGWAWGWLWGLAVLVGLFIAISVSNIAVMAATESLRAVRINRWAWIVFAAVAILVSTAQLEKM